MSVEIRKVQTKKELKEFIHFANDLYKGDEYYAPSLISDDYNTFDPKKPEANVCRYPEEETEKPIPAIPHHTCRHCPIA